MGTPVAHLLEHWHEFYLLLGTAAAALIALLFVAASIGAGILTPKRTAATRTYMSPVVVHYASVLFASLMALVPTQTHGSLGVLIGLNAIGGFIFCAVITARLLTDGIADLADRLGYGLMPLLCYVLAFAAACLLWRGSLWSPEVLAAALVLLLIVNIRNAWDLTLTLARQHSDES
jgi:hypothetical protein